ncbi:MAG TPA: disulfide bond formation protein DsbA [Dermatophilaceae bacterium]|nr:disulfide bond formation protein DsbA [Dermatophilaceae bacterium]
MTDKACVEMWFDPICPWAWLTSRWLLEVEKVRDVEVTWSVMSLAVLNGDREVSAEYASVMEQAWGPVRVIVAAARDFGPKVIQPLYEEMGTRIHLGGEEDYAAVIADSLREVGLPADLLRFATSGEVDAELRASHGRALALVGQEVGTPVIALGEIAFFGPVVTPAPKGEAAGRFWDGWVLMAGTPGFYELKRTRTEGPIFD